METEEAQARLEKAKYSLKIVVYELLINAGEDHSDGGRMAL